MTSYSDDYIRLFIAEAIEKKKAVRSITGDTYDAQALIDRLKAYRSYVGRTGNLQRVLDPRWRINKRKTGSNSYKVYLFSPESEDLPPMVHPPKHQPKTKKVRTKYFPDWVIDNLTKRSMHYITVIPREDFDRTGSIYACEQILLHLVQIRMNRDDVRVIVTRVKGGKKPEYNARLIFLGEA